MNTGQLERLLVEARSFLNDAVPAVRAGRVTQALVEAEAAESRLRVVMELYKYYIPGGEDLDEQKTRRLL